MIEAAVLSLLSTLPEIRSTIRARGSDAGFSNKFLFAPSETAPEEERSSQSVTDVCGAAVSHMWGDGAIGSMVVGSPASRRFEASDEIAHGAILGGTVVGSARSSPFLGISADAVQASDLVNAIEEIADEGNEQLTLWVVEASLDHPSSAVRATAIGALEGLLPTHPALVARLNWMRTADASPSVRAVAGEVLDYLE
jgi:hypothetical protein